MLIGMVAAVPGYPGITRRITRDNSSTCWRVSTHRPDGYAQWGHKGLVHRLAYVAFTGQPIPWGHQVHHLCGTRNCVNPDHLQLVGASEHSHIHHGVKRSSTSAPVGDCRHGHAWSEFGKVNAQDRWVCLECLREAGRRHDARRRSKCP